MKTALIVLLILSIFALAFGRSIISNSSEVSIAFHATNLTGCGLTKCDTSVTVYCQSISSDWKICDKTRVIRNNNNPTWPEVFSYDHTNGTRQRWRFDLKDHRILGGARIIASFYVNMDEYVESGKGLVELATPNNRGSLWMERQ